MPANKTPSDGTNAADQPDAGTTPTSRKSTAKSTAAGTTAAKATAAKNAGAANAAAKTTATKTTATKKATTGTTAIKPAVKASGSRPATKSGSGRPSGNRASAARQARAAALGSTGTRPRSKSIVVKRRTPWGLIITCVVVVIFAVAVIGYAVTRPKKISADDAPYVRNEIAAAKAIQGVLFKKHIQHKHITSIQKYDTSPPTGGDHSAVWADCSGTVYKNQIANENAVHPLEHGAVWITYRPGLDAKSVATLAKLVTGVNYMFMTPYAGLKTPISLQAWNYQLFVNSATDSRIKAFIKALRNNPGTTPEYPGNCVDAAFKANPSTPGHPTFS